MALGAPPPPHTDLFEGLRPLEVLDGSRKWTSVLHVSAFTQQVRNFAAEEEGELHAPEAGY